MKIRTQMTLALAAVALLPLCLAGVIAYHLSHYRLDAQADRTLQTFNRRVATEVDDFAFRAVESVRLASRIPAIATYLGSPSAEAGFIRQAKITDVLLAAVIPDPVNVTSCALFDVKGRKLVDTAPRLVDLDESVRPWVTRPLTDGLAVIVPSLDPATGPALWVATPVREASGRILGVLRLRYELAVLQQIVAQAAEERSRGVFSVLFDEQGRVLAHGTDPAFVGTAALPLPATSANGEVAWLRWSSEARSGGSPDRVAVRQLGRVPWRLAVAETGSVFHLASDDLFRTMLGLAALSITCGTLAVFLASSRLSRPITRLAVAAEQIGRGELDVTVPGTGQGEVSRLARTFNEMARRLAGTRGELEQKIAEVRASEEGLREILDASPIGILIYDERREALLINRKFVEMFGYDDSHIHRIDEWWPLAYPDPAYRVQVQAEWRQRVEEARRTGRELRPMETLVCSRDGTRREIEFRYREIGARRITLMADVTERRRAQQALQTSEERGRVLLEHATDATCVLDVAAGRFVDCNPSFERMFKLTREDVLRRGPAEISPLVQPDGRDSADAARRHMQAALEGVGQIFEWAHRDSTGREFPCEVRLVRLPDPERPLLHAVVIDVQERHRAIEQLRRSEQRFLTVFNASPVGLAIATADTGVILDANPAVCRLVGFPREQVLGRKTADFATWLPGERERITAEVLRTGRCQPFEKQLHTTADPVTVLVHFEAIEVDGQRRLLVALNDITDRKRTERTLRESEERFRLLVENSNDLVVQVSLDGTILYASPNHAAITGRGAEELVGTSVFARVHPDDQAMAAARFRAGEGQGLFRYQYRDGSWRWLESSGRRYRLRSGEERGVIVSRDVSERVQADETRKHLEAQLRQAQKMEAIGTLAGGIAHDFNNILTGLLGHLQLIEMDVPADATELRRSLTEATAAGGRAKDLVAQILAFSRQREQKRSVLSLTANVREALRFLRASLPATITIEDNLAAADCQVLADPTQMHQVIMNLGVNAGHAMRERGGVLTFALVQADPPPALAAAQATLRPGRTLRLTVADTGSGKDAATLERIFDPFFTTKPVGEGTGLGLAIVHGIIQDHGAAITVDSQVGVGTSFQIYFPMVESTPAVAPAVPADAPRGRGQHIMLVDDELLVLSVAQPMLKRLGYRTTVFDKSRAALEAYQQAPHDYDLIMTDLTMPEITGVELVTRIRALRPVQPVLIMTGYLRAVDLASARASGVTQFLTKPFTLTSMAEALQQALGKPGGSAGT